jgi:hypothetical protein
MKRVGRTISNKARDVLKEVLHRIRPVNPPSVRQGEWFVIRQSVTTGQLMRDVRRDLAVRRPGHVLGRDGHHRLTVAIIYKRGPQKGEVYARGTMRHTGGEHRMLSLPQNWYRVVHSIQGPSTLSARVRVCRLIQ